MASFCTLVSFIVWSSKTVTFLFDKRELFCTMYQYFDSKQMVNTTASTVELWMMMITLFMCHGKIAVNNH